MLKFFVLLAFFAVILYSVVQRDKKNKKSSESNEDLQEKIPEKEETMNASGVESDEIISDKQNSKDDVNDKQTKKIFTETHYAEDSLLLLTYIKDKCGCFGSDTLSENEKQQIEAIIDDALNNVFINRLQSNSICIYPPNDDGIAKYPYGNWIEVKENVKLKDAINFYLELKDCVKNEDEIKLDYVEYSRKYFEEKYEEKIRLWDLYEIWRANLTFFIVDKDFDLSVIDDKFAEKLKLNNIHLVAQKDELEFIDILNSAKYVLDYYDEPCGADWSGTNRYYNLTKIDAKTEEERLSDALLCKILLKSKEIVRYYKVSFEYFYDASLNQINIRISLNKNRLHFLTVYVNALNGMIKKFSFDIEEASDAHYEFDIFGAEKIRKICILNLHDSNYNHEEPLNVLLSKYLEEYGELSLIDLIKNVVTATFHFD